MSIKILLSEPLCRAWASTQGATGTDFSSSGVRDNPLTMLSLADLAPNTTYTIGLEAFNFQNFLSTRTAVSTATLAYPPDSTALSYVGASSVTVTWGANNNPLTPPTSYEVQISTWGGFTGVVTSSVTFALTASSEGLKYGSTYYLRVRAYNRFGVPTDFGSSVSTVTAQAVPVLAYFSPADINAKSIDYSWSKNGNEDGVVYIAQVSADPSFFFHSASGSVSLSITTGTLIPNTTYHFRVAAPPYDVFSAVLSTPTLAASPGIDSFDAYTTSVVLRGALTGNSAGTLYRAWASTQGVTGTDFSSAGMIVNPLTVLAMESLAPNTTYTIGFDAFNTQTLVSSRTAVSTATLAYPPVSLSLSTVGLSSVSVSWGANNNPLTPPTSYEVQISTWGGFTGVVTSSVTFALTASSEGLKNGSTYYLRVRAYKRFGAPTAFGSSVSTVTAQAVPVLAYFSPAAINAKSIDYSWSKNGNEDGVVYIAQVSADPSFFFHSASGSVYLSITTGTLIPNKTYHFRVAAPPYDVFSA